MRLDAGKSAREPSIARRHCCGQRAIEMQALTCGHVVDPSQMRMLLAMMVVVICDCS